MQEQPEPIVGPIAKPEPPPQYSQTINIVQKNDGCLKWAVIGFVILITLCCLLSMLNYIGMLAVNY